MYFIYQIWVKFLPRTYTNLPRVFPCGLHLKYRMPNAEIHQGRGSFKLLDRDLAGKKLLNVISPDSSDVTLIIRHVHAVYIVV